MTTFVPARLAALHRSTPVGAHVDLQKPSTYSSQRWADVLDGAGFSQSGERRWTLADSIRPNMVLLMCGLNPSPASADDGVAFARPGNRFWPAMLAANLAEADRDPQALLRRHRIGMTDIVKRTTRRADELSAAEYVDGLARLHRLAEWLEPDALCFVGLAGWRAAVDKKATPGWQEHQIGGRPAYVMPSTSGLNASAQLPDLVAHLRAATRSRRSC
ncbi:MAG: mismatch-specific DNA-glycosylase [Acidimicrobiia bacterium]|nr:mismatch-specific DNA-glycosylase [Acidimicrobiia bacterium]